MSQGFPPTPPEVVLPPGTPVVFPQGLLVVVPPPPDLNDWAQWQPPLVAPKSRPAIRLPLLSAVDCSVTTVITAIEHNCDGKHVVHFMQCQPIGRVVCFVSWLLAAQVVTPAPDSLAHRPVKTAWSQHK